MFPLSVPVALIVAALLGLIIYRLYLHPLAHVPGPKLAAITSWYEFYYECIKNGGGQVAHQLEKLHTQYGPIIRLNPWEVHINDPSFFEAFYSDMKLNNDPFFMKPFGRNGSMGATSDYQLHRTRRAVLSPCFSAANVRKAQPAILQGVQNVLTHLDTYRQEGKPANLSDAFRCYSADTVNTIVLPKPHLQLEDVGFANPLGKGLRGFASLLGWDRHLKFVFVAVQSIPPWLVAKIDASGATKAAAEFYAMFIENAKLALSGKDFAKSNNTALSMLDIIATSDQVPEAEKFVMRLVDEANNVSAAGTETTGSTLASLTFHLLSEPTLLEKLKAELQTVAEAVPEKEKGRLLSLKTLEKLPFLQACINETLRVTPAVSGRLPRQHRTRTFAYQAPSGQTYILPPGTTISMSIRDLHLDPSTFPEPLKFRPERWLNPDAKMQKHFVPFGRGARNCIGSELAKAEMLLMAGNLYHKVDLELFETSGRDISMAHDWFAPFAPGDSEGVRVLVK